MEKEIIEKVKEIMINSGFTENDMIFEIENIIPDGGKLLNIFIDKETDIELLNKIFDNFLMYKFNYYPNEEFKEKHQKIKFNTETFSYKQVEIFGKLKEPSVGLFFMYSPDIKKEVNHAIWILQKECKNKADEVRMKKHPFKY